MKPFHVAVVVLTALSAVHPAEAQQPYNRMNDLGWSQNSAATIAEVQRRLKREGYYIGEINGFFDNNTQSALLDFQTDRNLTLTGHMDQQTLAALAFPPDTQQAQVPLHGPVPETD
jgi:peptidoglycan hydrolase-like protein with peptidoglycan-binding domain